MAGGPRRWAPARVVSAVQAEAGLPEGGTVGRAGPVTFLAYRDNGLLRRLEVYPSISPGLLQWQVQVCDDAVRSPTAALWTYYKLLPGWRSLPERRLGGTSPATGGR